MAVLLFLFRSGPVSFVARAICLILFCMRAYITVLYSGVRRKFQFNGFNSIVLAYTNASS